MSRGIIMIKADVHIQQDTDLVNLRYIMVTSSWNSFAKLCRKIDKSANCVYKCAKPLILTTYM